MLDASATHLRLMLDTTQETLITLHQFYLPPWHARLNETHPLDTFPQGEFGLVATRVHAGTHTLTLAWEATPTVRFAMWLSTVAALGGLLWLGRGRRRQVLAVVMVGSLVAAGMWGYHARHRVEVMPVNAAFDEWGWLLGWQPDSLTVSRGQPFHLTLYWLSRRTVPTDYNIFIHITPLNDGRPVAQYDGYPNSGFTPTTRWEAGEIVITREMVDIPETLPPGTYNVWAGVYEWRTLERWPVLGREDGRIYLGTIEVRE